MSDFNFASLLAHNFDEKRFEKLTNTLAKRLKGNEILHFSDGTDKAKDGNGIASFIQNEYFKQNRQLYVIQAKHCSNSDESCSKSTFYGNKSSIINKEVEAIKEKLVRDGEIEFYILFTNRKLTGNKSPEIKKYISNNTGLDYSNIELIGLETINVLLNDKTNFDLVKKYFESSISEWLHQLQNIEIKNIELTNNDKPNFIGNIKPNNNFIERTLLLKNDENYHRYFDGESINKVIDNKNFIAILGNPGTGKTSLLKQIALKYWKEGKQNSYTPIYRNLRNFSSQQTLENYLPEKIKNTPYPLFILDGIDEIQNIENFKSELNTFIEKYNTNCKYIISCRNNIYDSVVRKISSFKIYHLKDLSYDQSISLLQKLCPLITLKDFTLNNRHREFIQTPQQSEILAEYINKNNKLSYNFSELWGTYIEQRLKDNYDKLEKRPYDTFLFINEAPKIGVIGELMQTTNLLKTNLKKLLNNNYRDVSEFTLSPLINSDDYVFSFENRNIQEYFAAKIFAELKKEEILSQFIIKDCNKIHPNLINTLSFLLQLVDDDTHNFIVNWLLKNESELFFKFDNSRINKDIKLKIFQDYFKKQCIDKSLWIGDSYTVEEITKFGDCAENQQLLIDIIKNDNFHFRITESALYLLGNFSIYGNEKELIELFKKMIASNKVDIKTKQEVLHTVYLLRLTKSNNSFLSFLIASFSDYDEQGIRYHLMKLLELESSIDNYFAFFFEEFKKENNIEDRKVSSEVRMGGYEWVIDKLLLKIENDDLFLIVFQLFFTHQYKVYNKITDKLLQKTVEKIQTNNEFIIKLYENIERDYLLFDDKQKSIILKLCILSNTENYLCEHITNQFPRKDYLNISLFISKINIDTIISIIFDKKDEVQNDEFERLRNDIRWVKSTELAILFDQKLQQLGITFKQPVLTIEKEEEQKSSFQSFKQENFDLLFNKERLLNKIRLLFDENNNAIDFDSIHEIENTWTDDKGHQYYNLNSAINVIHEILHHYTSKRKQKINFQFVEEKTHQYPIILIKKIKMQLDNDTEIKINNDQIEQIYSWCKTVIKELDLNKIWVLNENRKDFSYSNYDYKKIEFIYYFKNRLNIDIEKSFILNSLPFLFGLNNSKEVFDEVKNWYGNLLEFEKHVIEKIKYKSLPIYIETVYIDYAIENSLNSVKEDLKAHFLLDNYHSSSSFTLFIENFQLQNSLKDYCLDINNGCCWSALKMLLEIDKSNTEFCCQKSIEYLQTQYKINKYRRNSLEILFKTNHPYILDFILKEIQKDNFQDLESYDLIEANNYNYYLSEKIIITIFDFIYLKDWKSMRDVYHIKRFFEKYIENLVEHHYDKIKNIFKKKLEHETAKDSLFYLNHLIDLINQKHISNLSKPLEFDDALEFVSSL